MWDNEALFSSKQILADGDSDHIVDTGGDDYGLGGNAILQVALGRGCSGTLAVSLQSGDDPGLTDAVRVVQYVIQAERVAKGGVVLAAALPTGCKRYLRLSYAGATGGLVTAGLVAGAQTNGMH